MISKITKKPQIDVAAQNKTRYFLFLLFAIMLVPYFVFSQTADITGPSNFNDCQQQTMTITIVNNGTDPATNVVVDYFYLSGFSFVSGTSLITYPAPPNDTADPGDNGSRLRWTLTQDINPGATVTLTFDLITNCSAQSGTHSVTVTYDPGSMTTSDTVYLTVNHGALVVTKTPAVTNAFVGDTITWTLNVRSTGFGPASNIELTDILGTGFTFISTTIPGGILTYTHPSLATGDSLSYTVTARIDSCIDLENTMNVRWGCGGGVFCQENLSSSASINLTVREPALEFVSITPSPIIFNFCQEATVSVSIRNNGTGPAITPHLTPTLPAGYQITNTTAPVTWNGTLWTLPTITAGNTLTFSFELTTGNYCALNNGLILFDADCTNECGNLFTSPQVEIASMNVLSDFPSLSVTKTAPVEIEVGQAINYAVTASYNGNPAYSGDISIVDTLPANITPINITGGGVYNSGAGTITWTVLAPSVINGVILNATFDGPTTETFPDICLYCFNTLTNTITASTQVTCPLTPALVCDLTATASASTRINCRETGGTATVTGSKDAAFNTTENCTTIPYTLTFTFGTGITDSWSTISLQEMMNNGQTPSGDATFTVGAVSVIRPVPADGNWGLLDFLGGASAAGQTLVVTYSLYQPNPGSYYNDAVLTVPSLGGGICGDGDQQILVTELVAAEASSGAISVDVPTFLDQCETITVTMNISKGTYNLYNPVVRFISSDYTYVPGSTTWSGDGTTFPGGNIEPSISGSTLTWNNTQWGLPYLGAGSDQYYAFQNGGTITFLAVKSSSCSNLPGANAELYFDDNCERLGRNGLPSENLKSSSSDSPIVLSKGNILIRKFPELVTATSDTVSFTVTLVNTGDGTSYNTVITDILGADMLFDPAYTGAASVNPDTVDGVLYNPTITGRTLIFNLGDLAPNDIVLITIPARIVGCDESQMFNLAEGSWGCGGSPSDCQVLPVSRQVNVNLQDSNLLIRGSGDVYLCEQNTLQLDILNSGRTMDYSVEAVFIIPTGLNYVAGSTWINGSIAGEPVQVGNELIWAFNSYEAYLGDLDPDEMISLTFDVMTDCDLSNSVSFQGYGRYIAPCDNFVGNISNTVTYTLEINDNRAILQVSKLPASQTGELNDIITWTITIRNTGLGTGYHLEFYDALPAGVTIPASPVYGISNQALNGVPQLVFDDGLSVFDMGTSLSPRTLIDIPPSGIITFDVTVRVDSCSPLTSQNQANVQWGCDDGCRFSYIPGYADLTTSPVIALINHQLASESICGAIFSFEVQNTGSRAVSVDLVDTLPAGFVYTAGTATISSDYIPARDDLVAEPAGEGTGTITWDATNVPLVYPGETITITFEARNDVAAGFCSAPINGTNSIAMTYNNSCGDSFGPVNSTITVDLNLPNFTIDVQPDTQIVPSGTPVCWNIVLSNGVGGDIVDSVDVEIAFGPDYSAGAGDITAGNGSDGTVPVIAGNTVTYTDISVNETSNWTANVCGTAITNPDVSQLWVSATATGECSSGCFFGSASDTSASAVGQIVKTVGPATATIGEEVTYTITVDYDGGTSIYQNTVITDTLPPNISFVSQVSYSGPNAPVAPTCAAGVCTWNVGNFTSSATGEQTVIIFTARVDNVAANQNGDVRTNTARATYIVNGYNYDDSDTVDFTIIEPELVLAKTRTSAATGDAGDTVSYRLQTNHLGTSTAVAYDVVITDTVPADMTYVAGSQASAPAATSFTQIGQVLTWTYDSLPIGTTSVITFDVTVNNTVEPAQVITNPAQTTWTSLSADADPNERNGSGGVVNDYFSSSSVNFTIISPTIDKILTGAATHTIGSTVPYQITVYMIEGTTDNFRVRELMPDFLTIDTSSILVSPAWTYTQTITGPNDGTANSYITWDFETVNNSAPGQNLVITFNLIVADVAANDDGDTFTNRGQMLYNNYNNTAVTVTDNAQVITIRVPALVTNKTITAVNGGAPTATVSPGDIITYQYTVNNAGTGAANSVNITDTFPNLYLAYVAGSARLNLALTADPTGLPGPNLNFNLSEPINGGATITLTFNARVLSTVSSGTVINNISYATGLDAINNPIPADNTDHVAGDTDLDDLDNESITAVVPGLVVDKSVLLINGAPSAGIVQPGDTVTYQVTIQNVGGANAIDVDLTDILPSSDFTYVNNSTTLDGVGPAANPSSIVGNTLTWDFNLTINGGDPTGSTRTITFDVLVGSGIHQATVYINTASAVNGVDGNGTAIPTASTDVQDTDLDDTDTADLTAAEPALVTDKIVFQVNGGAPSGTPPFVSVGDVVTFRYTVTNVGTGTAYNLDLTDILPSGFTYQAGSTNITWPSGSYFVDPPLPGINLSWDSSAQLAGSEVLTLLFNATVQNSAFMPIPAGGQFENIASATADDGAGTAVPTDNSADVPADTDLDDTDNAFMQPADPALIVDKSFVSINSDPLRTFTEPGDTVIYRVTIQNVGGAPALNVDLQDTIDTATTYIAGMTNASWNGAFSGLHTADPSIAGSVLTWDSSVIVGGNGTVLSPGATVTYDFSVHVTSSVTLGGTILNTGYGLGVDGAGVAIPANNSASVPADTDLDDTDSVTLPTYKPGLVTDKTVALINGAAPTGFIEPGDVITYQYTVQNVGQAVAYDVDITDTLPSSDFTYVNNSTTLDGVGPAANPSSIVGNTLTWDLNLTINGGDPTGATRTLRFNVTVGSGIHQGTVYTNTNWAVNGTDGDGGAIALASGDDEDNDLDDSDAVDLTGREPALVTDKVVSLVNGAVPGSFPPIVAPSDFVTFQYTVTNVGAGTAYNVDLTDVLPNGYTYQAGSTNITWPLGLYTTNPTIIAGVNLSWDSTAQLAGGEALTLTFITLVTNDAYRPLPAGNWINTASAFGDDGAGTPILADNNTDVPADTDLDDTDTADLIPAQPALVTDKEVVSVNGVVGAMYVQPGDYIRYRYTVTNVGRGIAFNVDSDDTLDIGLSYDTALVPPTTTAASWTGDYAGSHTANPIVTGVPLTGESLLWNSSTILGTADGIILTSGAVLTTEYDIYVTSDIVQGTPVDNSAHASAIDGRGTAVPADNSGNVAADTDLDDRDNTVLLTEEPALIVLKSSSLSTVRPGDVVTFTVTVQNVGLGDALNLYLTDQLPACFSYISGSTRVTWPSDPTDTVLSPWNMNPTIAGNSLIFNIGAKLDGGDPIGETLTLTFRALVGTGCPTEVTNNVLARGVDGDSNPIILGGVDPDDTDDDDADSVNLIVLVPELSLQKSIALINGSAPGTTIQPGDTITYDVVIRNTGLAPLMRLVVTDIKPSSTFEYISGSSMYNSSSISDPIISGLQLQYEILTTLNAGETATLRLSFKAVSVSDGMVYTNCADVVGYDAAGGEINTDESCVDITGYVPPSDGDISKLRCDVQTSGINNRLCAGNIASYCVTLYNNDTLSIHDPHLTFVLPMGIDLVPGTFVLDGKPIPDPSITAGTVDVTLSTVLPKTTSVVCFQMIATANAKLGRIDFEFVVTDRTGKSTTCAIANIITVDDCQETNCGGIEKLNYPIRECNRLVAVVKPEFDTAYAMYAAGSFYRFAASAAVINNASNQTITADYNDLWKFRLFDIAEKNLDAVTMRSGLSSFVQMNEKELLQVIYKGAAPYFDRNEQGEATFWSSEIDDSISTASIGLTLFAQAERLFALKQKVNYLMEAQSQRGLIEETESQMRAKVHLIDLLINQSSTTAAPIIKSLPETTVLKIANGKAEFVTVASGNRIIETSASILLGVSRYLQWENSNSSFSPAINDAKTNASNSASKIGSLAFAHITKSVDDAINSFKLSSSQNSVNVDKDQDSSFDLRALTLATEALAEWIRVDATSANEADAVIKKIGNFVANLQNPDGSFSIDKISSDFKNQITAIKILSDCQKAVSGTDYNNQILKGYSFIENTMWIDKFGLYRSGNTGGVFSYNPFDLAVYVQNYLTEGLRLKTLGKDALDSRLYRFLDTLLNSGGMQLDDGWRQNEHLLVSSFSAVPKTAVFSVPMGKHLMPVLNAKIEFVDPVAQVPESLIELDGKNLIKLESLNCSASYAAPSQRQFVTDIGNFALSELYDASLNFSSYTYPTYLMNKLPNTAWILARKMGEYALYNSFTLDYSSKSGLDLRFSEELMKEIPADSAAAEIKLRELLSRIAGSAGENFDFRTLTAFKPLFILFGTALPGADRSIGEQMIINPKLLGYSEDRRIFLSDVGLNLVRQASEYKFIEKRKAESRYVLPILKAQIIASLEFMNKYFMKGIDQKSILPSYIYPEINSSGEPLNYISSTEKTDLFSMLSILEGATAAMESKDKDLSAEAKGMADKLVSHIIQNFYDKMLGRFRNSQSDADLSTVNIYYLHKLGMKTSSWLNTADRRKFTDENAALLKNKILDGSAAVKISVDGKPEKLSSIVDINTAPAANFAALRMALNIYKVSNNAEWLNIAKRLWQAQLDEGYDSTLKIFKGSHTSDEKIQEQVIYRYNSYDIGMIIGAANEIMPFLEENGRITAFEGLRVFFDKIVEGAEVQYLPFKEKDRFHTGEFELLPGLRTEVTVKYDDNILIPNGIYPGETVKFILKMQNRCAPSIAGESTSEYDFIDITDILPPRFTYIKGTTYVNNVKGPEPHGDDILSWKLNGMGSEGIIILTFLAHVDTSATEGDYINYAKMGYIPTGFGTAFVAPSGWAQSLVKILKASALKLKFFEDVNANGTRDEGEIEHLIPSFTLTLDSITSFSSTRTGTFESLLVKPGYHSLSLPTINPDTYWWLSGGNPVQFHSRIETDTVLEIPLTYRRIMEGYVFDDLNGNGIYDKEDSEGLENIELETSSGLTIISGERGYFYYISQSPNETVRIKSDQRFTSANNARIEMK